MGQKEPALLRQTMNKAAESIPSNAPYDIIHFEALGPEAEHLKEEIKAAQAQKLLPDEHRYLITPRNIQEFLAGNPETPLPDIITIKTHSVIPETYLEGTRKGIVTRSAGYDHVEHLAQKASITSLREYCVNAVAQTAMKFLYCAAGELNHYTNNVTTFERNRSKAFMELDGERVLTVFGVGKIGRKIYELAVANGLSVQAVDIRQEQLSNLYGNTVRFVSPEEAIGSSDIIVNAMNLTRDEKSQFYNVGYFSKEFLSKASKELIFINVTRGEIAPESVLLELYQAGRIRGIGTDVFTDEVQFAELLNGRKTTSNSYTAAAALVKHAVERTANMYVQPHQAFNSDVAARTKAVEAIRHVIAWYGNSGKSFDEQLPYY